LGSLQELRRVFDPVLRISQSGQTGALAGQIVSVSGVGGSLDVARNWRRYHLAATYSGGETINQPSYLGMGSLPYHRLGISQDIFLGRWTLHFREDAQYSRASGFGGIFIGGLPDVGQNGVLDSIQPSLVPSQTIQTGLGPQLNNTVLSEADYAVSRRTTLTVMGSYGVLRFFTSSYLSSQDIHERLGYNYALSAKNNIALTYDHDRTSFTQTSSHTQSDLVQLAFGRELTGRLAFQLAVGPELLYLDNLGSPNTRQLSWSAFSALTYNLHHNRYSFSYSHAATGGSGVFLGSNNDTLIAGVSRELTKFWSASVNGGYAINRSLAAIGFFASRFDNWYVIAGLSRQIGRQLNMGLSYELQQQSSGSGVCQTPVCGFPASIHQFGITLQWHPIGPAR
jgi:hypothetical protein